MSTAIMSACWPIQGMTPAQKAVLISLADNANDEGVCWPSVANISMRTCLSERAVQAAIKWLCQSGYLIARERSGRSTVYMLTPAGNAPPQQMRGAADAPHPRSKCTPPPQMLHPTPADAAPRTVKNRHRTVKEPSRRKSAPTDDEFELAWSLYPKREGGDSRSDALKAWRARIRSGDATADEMTDGVRRYAAFLRAKGKVGTEFVKRACTFFGPGGHYRERYAIAESDITGGHRAKFDPSAYVNQHREPQGGADHDNDRTVDVQAVRVD
ncbi:helix-turn-helix domain-containing protein [Allopusillimonas soli]|uniref:Helix-turn-helix domain-containing protein n=1 Tax=Allopusillimonas soli TaxID=659016 RepID=A0A853FJH4_9BURK|nr:helix-turn-helix domain-containing protein [Allopusillimonas soli]NYT38890.1 helix-turn-helix domain-containing protein [Allopusillimonas soli]TEA70111.1 helix-turn-helix domain-containing protein [Allopusillimonas soli]